MNFRRYIGIINLVLGFGGASILMLINPHKYMPFYFIITCIIGLDLINSSEKGEVKKQKWQTQ